MTFTVTAAVNCPAGENLSLDTPAFATLPTVPPIIPIRPAFPATAPKDNSRQDAHSKNLNPLV
jgi:hypothetical protein